MKKSCFKKLSIILLLVLTCIFFIGLAKEPDESFQNQRNQTPSFLPIFMPVMATESSKIAALTFDDGPHPVYTPKLLDGLKERNVKATFFLIGQNIEGNEEIIKRMSKEGHLIGNHTYHHVNLATLKFEEA